MIASVIRLFTDFIYRYNSHISTSPKLRKLIVLFGCNEAISTSVISSNISINPYKTERKFHIQMLQSHYYIF